MKTDCLIIFTRYPTIGQVKTRLIPAVGAEGAAQLHRHMTEQTLTQVQALQKHWPLTVEIHFAGNQSYQAMATWLGTDWQYRPQTAGDLGERMSSAFTDARQAGMERVVIIGTDCPGLNAEFIQDAFAQLLTHDLVLGPAIDGGYYLIGLRSLHPELFAGISWSTDRVLTQTIEIGQRLNLSLALLPFLADIDRPADLSVWEQARSQNNQSSELISIIMPARNEAQTISRAIASARANLVEIIVVDGDSIDGTRQVAESLGAKVISSAPGRAHQMNAGAEAASGQILLFLHADTCLPVGFADLVRGALQLSWQQSQKITVAGAFTLQIDGAAAGLRVIEWGVKWRSRIFQMPYGDQAIFLRTETFQKIGGFPAMPLMEDFELVSRLKRWGTIAILPETAITSGRRWLSKGIWQTTIINQAIVVAYWLGVSPDLLVRWYRRREL
jgi:rSAM/selenodomain-associated transferase 2/rSAM/selenodomain-associated transferase 1